MTKCNYCNKAVENVDLHNQQFHEAVLEVANEGDKTFTCAFCGKVGDDFSGMAQEICPDNGGNGHQIPIFGDMPKRPSFGNEALANEEADYNLGDTCAECGHEFQDRGECPVCTAKESLTRLEESWDNKSNDARWEAFEKIGFKSEEAIIMANLTASDLSHEVKLKLVEVEEADKEEHRQASKDAFNEEGDQPDTEVGQDIDYNQTFENHNTRSAYECEHCNAGYKSNEALMTHFNDTHARHTDGKGCLFCTESVDPEDMVTHLAYEHAFVAKEYTPEYTTDPLGEDQARRDRMRNKHNRADETDDYEVDTDEYLATGEPTQKLPTDKRADESLKKKQKISETTIDKCIHCGRQAMNHSNPNTDYRGMRGDAPPTDHYYEALDDGVESFAKEYEGQAELDAYGNSIPDIDPTGASSLKSETDFIFPKDWDQDTIDQEAKYRLTDDLDWVGGNAYRNKTTPWQDGYEFAKVSLENFTGQCPECKEHYEDTIDEYCVNCGASFDENDNVSEEAMPEWFNDPEKRAEAEKANDERVKQMKDSEEAMYGYGSATGRMSPAESWKQMYMGGDVFSGARSIPQADMDAIRNFEGLGWNELPSDIQELWKSMAEYMPSGEAFAKESWEDHFEEEYTMDQDGMYKCKICGVRLDLHGDYGSYTPDEVAHNHLKTVHQIGEAKPKMSSLSSVIDKVNNAHAPEGGWDKYFEDHPEESQETFATEDGTSAGAKKGWDTRGRGGKAEEPKKEFIPIDWAGQVGATKSEADQDKASDLMDKYYEIVNQPMEGLPEDGSAMDERKSIYAKGVADFQDYLMSSGNGAVSQDVVDILEDENYHSLNKMLMTKDETPEPVSEPETTQSERDTEYYDTTSKNTLDTLNAGKVNGFPFFMYAGKPKILAKDGKGGIVMAGMKRNPAQIGKVHIKYDEGRDTYGIEFTSNRGKPKGSVDDIYFDQLTDIIVDKMGIR